MDRSDQLVSITSIGPKSLAIVWAASWTVVEVRLIQMEKFRSLYTHDVRRKGHVTNLN